MKRRIINQSIYSSEIFEYYNTRIKLELYDMSEKMYSTDIYTTQTDYGIIQRDITDMLSERVKSHQILAFSSKDDDKRVSAVLDSLLKNDLI